MKKVIVIVVVFLVISCNNQKPSKPMNTSENHKVVKQYFEYFNNHDWKKMSEMYTQTADFKDPSLGPGIVKQSRQQIQNKPAERIHAGFFDLHHWRF